MFMNTDLEKQVGLGADYPYPALGSGECNVPSSYQILGKKIGDTVTIRMTLGHMLITMAAVYNAENEPIRPIHSVLPTTRIEFPCTIKNFITESYGKYS